MAEKYVSHGNTYDGDGTTIAAATVNGGVGSWNDLKAIMQAAPTYGTLSAGDTVHIRSKLSGANITVNMATTASLTGYTIGSQTAPVHWKVDDGTKWAGDDGILTMNVYGNSYDLIFGYYGIYDGNGLRWVINDTGTGSHSQNWFQLKYSIAIAIKTTYTVASINIGSVTSQLSSTWYDMYFDCRRAYSSGYNSSVVAQSGTIHFYVNCEWHIDDLYKNSSTMYVLAAGGSYGNGLNVFGGKISNNDPGFIFLYKIYSSIAATASQKVGYFLKGFNYNGAVVNDYTEDMDGTEFCIHNTTEIDGKPFDFLYETPSGNTSWRAGKNYPVLNASLPDNTAWSIRNFAGYDISIAHPMEILKTTKYYNLTATQKKITIEILVKDTSSTNGGFDDIKKKDWFFILSYRDNTTGKFITEVSDRDDAALATSAAGWIPVVSGNIVYGENSYNAHKIELTTTNSIKQNSLITLVLFTTRKAQASSDFNFADPDFKVEAI